MCHRVLCVTILHKKQKNTTRWNNSFKVRARVRFCVVFWKSARGELSPVSPAPPRSFPSSREHTRLYLRCCCRRAWSPSPGGGDGGLRGVGVCASSESRLQVEIVERKFLFVRLNFCETRALSSRGSSLHRPHQGAASRTCLERCRSPRCREADRTSWPCSRRVLPAGAAAWP